MNHQLAELAQTSTCRDKVTADNVLLHTLQIIDLALDSRLVEHLGCLLEGSSRDERLRTQSGAGDTQQDLLGGSTLGVTHLNKFLILTA